MTTGTVRPATDGQKRDINSTLLQAVPDLSFDEAERIIGKKGPFLSAIKDVFDRYKISDELIAGWQEFWGTSLAGLVIPLRRPGFDRLIVIPQGTSIEGEFQKCKALFGAWKYTEKSLDELVTKNDRNPSNGAYAIWVRDRIEADEEHKNKSANDLLAAKIAGITLLERLVYERKYFRETGKHLDIENLTLCSGSRDSGGIVPDVCCYSYYSKVYVYWYNPDIRHGSLRSREVVAV